MECPARLIDGSGIPAGSAWIVNRNREMVIRRNNQGGENGIC